MRTGSVLPHHRTIFRSRRGRAIGAALGAGVIAALTVLPAADASAASAHVQRQNIDMVVAKDGTTKVTERVTYDYASGNAGFTRSFVTRTRYSDTEDRVIKLSDIEVTSDGADVPTRINHEDGTTTVDVDPGKELQGRKKYEMTYTVDGMMVPSTGGVTLSWTPVSGWTVPARKVNINVIGPQQPTHVSCTAGAPGASVPCTLSQAGGEGVAGSKFLQNDLPARGVFDITVGMPQDAVDAEPILEKRHTLVTAFSVTPFTVAALVAVLVLGLIGLWLLWRIRGRDARSVAAGSNTGGRRPFHEEDGTIVFSPPGGLRPGQVGTLVDEQADVVDIVATILDLAVRNYIFIEELGGARPDWRLYKRNEPGDELLPYERAVFDELFEHGDDVLVSDLRSVLASDMPRLRQLMYHDVVTQGWFASRPDQVRSRWLWGGVALAIAGVAITVLLALFTFDALVGLAVVILGIGVAVAAEYMPSRTSRGSEVLGQINGLRQYLQGADPADIPAAEQETLCARLVPYAALFGAEDRWAHALSESEDVGDEGFTWYGGPEGWSREHLDDSVANFLVDVTGAVSTSRPLRGVAG
ncbi:MAG: DUF2207 domain-containing protein [Streptosporangiales bacterium]|nr:DUF2207 domain-containing protein [Streptosporangiales bacterium]